MNQIVKRTFRGILPTLCGKRLIEFAKRRIGQGLVPPCEIYRIEVRRCLDWSELLLWARPVDPEVFDRCCHEG
jgi:hypothetical protein